MAEMLSRQRNNVNIKCPSATLPVTLITGGETIVNPTFSPPDGHTFLGSFNASIVSETEGTKVYYTTNGTDPNQSDSRYRGQNLKVDKDITYKARAFKNDSFENFLVE